MYDPKRIRYSAASASAVQDIALKPRIFHNTRVEPPPDFVFSITKERNALNYTHNISISARGGLDAPSDFPPFPLAASPPPPKEASEFRAGKRRTLPIAALFPRVREWQTWVRSLNIAGRRKRRINNTGTNEIIDYSFVQIGRKQNVNIHYWCALACRLGRLRGGRVLERDGYSSPGSDLGRYLDNNVSTICFCTSRRPVSTLNDHFKGVPIKLQIYTNWY